MIVDIRLKNCKIRLSKLIFNVIAGVINHVMKFTPTDLGDDRISRFRSINSIQIVQVPRNFMQHRKCKLGKACN